MSADDSRRIRQLIVLCLRPRDCELPSSEAEWKSILLLAVAHGVAPLLHIQCKERELPNSIRAKLRALYVANSFRNEKLLAEQQRLFAAFSEKSISVWPLKGPHLAEKLYGDFATRQFADLDLLIQPGDLSACDAVLQSLGYFRQTHAAITTLRDAGELIYLRSAPDTAESFTFAVDLQQRVLPYGRRDPLAGRIRAHGMTPENLLLLLCVNQVAHRFARLKHLVDVAAWLRALPENFNWDDFTAAARELDFTPGIYLSLLWARDAAAAPVPASVISSLRPGANTLRSLARSLGADPVETLARCAALDGPAGAWAILACTRSGLPRARQFARLLFPPPATLRQEFFATPGRPIFYLYLARLVRKIPSALRRQA